MKALQFVGFGLVQLKTPDAKQPTLTSPLWGWQKSVVPVFPWVGQQLSLPECESIVPYFGGICTAFRFLVGGNWLP